MNPALRQESEKLHSSWMRHDAVWLRDYLVAGIEDPRINVQSILSRHFLIWSVFGDTLNPLMVQECRFAATMNWLQELVNRGGGAEEGKAVLHALSRKADNAEGLPIPWFVVETFAQLPTVVGGVAVPNYIERFFSLGDKALQTLTLNTFCDLWVSFLSAQTVPTSTENPGGSQPLLRPPQRRSVIEPACGSANDYRYLHQYGLARWIDYFGFDLCLKNVENARALFPQVGFDIGNVFEIAAPDKGFDLCIVHDLFEHLSAEGLQAAIEEICRVARIGICAGFFQMDEIPDHIIRPLDDYFVNLLSMERTKELFVRCGFKAHVIHIGTFLRDEIGCETTCNPHAYTFMLTPSGGLANAVDS